MVKKIPKNTYEAYRKGDIVGEYVIMTVKASSVQNAVKLIKEQLKKLYGDEKHFNIRQK